MVSYTVDARMDPALTETYMQCVPCQAGTYSTGVSGECMNCPVGTYQNETGKSGCMDCPTNSQGAGEGMSTCTPCRPGTILRDGGCRPCPDGQFYPLYLDGVCFECPVGMWSDQTSGGCRMCPEFSVGPGATNLSGCQCWAGRVMELVQGSPSCVACASGKFAEAGSLECTNCRNGTYAWQTGASACLNCPGGSVTLAGEGATSCTACPLGFTPGHDLGSCVVCPAGFVCYPDGQVIPCPIGTYSLATGLTSLGQCPLCPRNFACRNPTSIESCPTHTTSQPGSINLHMCVCDRGFRCTYSFSTRGRISLSVTRQQLELTRQALILAIARKAVVDPSKVEILEIRNS